MTKVLTFPFSSSREFSDTDNHRFNPLPSRSATPVHISIITHKLDNHSSFHRFYWYHSSLKQKSTKIINVLVISQNVKTRLFWFMNFRQLILDRRWLLTGALSLIILSYLQFILKFVEFHSLHAISSTTIQLKYKNDLAGGVEEEEEMQSSRAIKI